MFGLLAGLGLGAAGLANAGANIAGGVKNKRASEEHARAMREAAKNYSGYREAFAPAKMDALKQVLSLYGPMNEHMANTYGEGARQDLQQVFKNPISEDMSAASPFVTSGKEAQGTIDKLNGFLASKGAGQLVMKDGKVTRVGTDGQPIPPKDAPPPAPSGNSRRWAPHATPPAPSGNSRRWMGQ
jgi:hypothetical protein